MKKEVVQSEKKEKKPKVQKITKTKKSKSKKDLIDNHDPLLYEYLKFNSEKNLFECSICSKATKEKRNLLRHIKLIHLDEIKSNNQEPNENDNKSDLDLGDPMIDSIADFPVDDTGGANDSIGDSNPLPTEPKLEEPEEQKPPQV